MFDEHQDIQSPEQHDARVRETGCDDPGGLGVQELPPARARAPRRRIDARGMQNLPHGRRRDRHAGLHELTVDPSVSPQRVLPRQADDKTGDTWACRRASRHAPPAHAVLPRRQPAVPGQQRRRRHREDPGPASLARSPRNAGTARPGTRHASTQTILSSTGKQTTTTSSPLRKHRSASQSSIRAERPRGLGIYLSVWCRWRSHLRPHYERVGHCFAVPVAVVPAGSWAAKERLLMLIQQLGHSVTVATDARRAAARCQRARPPP
jgi:hypothetical protein